MIHVLYAIMIMFTYSKHIHYSTFGFVFLFFTKYLQNPIWHYLAMNNTIGFSLTWYWAVLLDRSIPRRMMTRYNWTLIEYVFGDFILHTAPMIYSLYCFREYTIWYPFLTQNKLYKHSGLYTAFMNLVWCFVNYNGFEAVQGYVETSSETLNYIWVGNTMFHFIPMLLR